MYRIGPPHAGTPAYNFAGMQVAAGLKTGAFSARAATLLALDRSNSSARDNLTLAVVWLPGKETRPVGLAASIGACSLRHGVASTARTPYLPGSRRRAFLACR